MKDRIMLHASIDLLKNQILHKSCIRCIYIFLSGRNWRWTFAQHNSVPPGRLQNYREGMGNQTLIKEYNVEILKIFRSERESQLQIVKFQIVFHFFSICFTLNSLICWHSQQTSFLMKKEANFSDKCWQYECWKGDLCSLSLHWNHESTAEEEHWNSNETLE